ncbi:unnamed protein product [Amoebophrya sp. A25]|nr:unnamed protein product [Amoebophrya sp. A25]|eukprot:GSA25T00007155001.1
MLRQARDPEALCQFLYLEADFSKGDAAAQRDAGWQSKAQVQAVWDFLYMKWDLPKKDARNKLVELSGKWVSLSHLPEDKTQIDAWFRYFYNSVDLSKQESGQRVFTMMTQEPWRLKDDPKNLEKILKEIDSCSDLSKQKAGQLAAKFNDADQVKAIWQALYNTCDYTKADATRILKEVEDWHWIDDTWIKKQWKKYYTDEDKTKLESQRLIQQELISYAQYTKENKYGNN